MQMLIEPFQRPPGNVMPVLGLNNQVPLVGINDQPRLDAEGLERVRRAVHSIQKTCGGLEPFLRERLLATAAVAFTLPPGLLARDRLG